MQVYESIVQNWGHLVDIPITIGNRQHCRIAFEDGVVMQIDLDPSGERLVLSSNLGVLSAGSYRNLMFKTALRANGLSVVPRGILSFSNKLGSLFLHEFLPVATTDAQKLKDAVALFRAHAKVWIDAIKQGNIPIIEGEQDSAKGSGMFGLKS